MHKIFATFSAFALIAIAAPVVSAETVTEEYLLGLGASVAGTGRSLIVCPAGCDLDEDGNDDVTPLGGVDILTSGALYTNVVVSINDEGLWGANGAMATCFYNPAGDFICDDDDYSQDQDCGVSALIGSPIASDFVSAFLYDLLVSEDLEVCGATFGTVSATFF